MCKPLVEFSEECLTSKLLFWVGEGERDELHHRYSKMFNIYLTQLENVYINLYVHNYN